MGDNRQAVQGVRTGGRSARVRAAVLEAVLAELAEVGYARLTFDGVAARAGVSKTTVYRRWADQESLVVDALTEWTGVDIPIPDTGSLESDLRALAASIVDLLNSTLGRAVVGTLVAARPGASPGLIDVNRRFFDERHRRAGVVVERAVARGELPPEIDATDLLSAVRAPLYSQVLTTDEALDDAAARRAVDAALAAARAGVFSRRAPGAGRTAGRRG